jgi:hypothetical protein
MPQDEFKVVQVRTMRSSRKSVKRNNFILGSHTNNPVLNPSQE